MGRSRLGLGVFIGRSGIALVALLAWRGAAGAAAEPTFGPLARLSARAAGPGEWVASPTAALPSG